MLLDLLKSKDETNIILASTIINSMEPIDVWDNLLGTDFNPVKPYFFKENKKVSVDFLKDLSRNSYHFYKLKKNNIIHITFNHYIKSNKILSLSCKIYLNNNGATYYVVKISEVINGGLLDYSYDKKYINEIMINVFEKNGY